MLIAYILVPLLIASLLAGYLVLDGSLSQSTSELMSFYQLLHSAGWVETDEGRIIKATELSKDAASRKAVSQLKEAALNDRLVGGSLAIISNIAAIFLRLQIHNSAKDRRALQRSIYSEEQNAFIEKLRAETVEPEEAKKGLEEKFG